MIEEYTLREELKKIDAVRKEQKRHLPASIESELVSDRLAALKKKQGSRSSRPTVPTAVDADTVGCSEHSVRVIAQCLLHDFNAISPYSELFTIIFVMN